MFIGHQKLTENFKALADRQDLSQGYLFHGEAGVGKHAFALALAHYLETKIFENSPTMCSDLLDILPVENTIGIDRVREIKNFLWQLPNRSAYRTVILDRADSLTDEAQNALLKIAEEPPRSALLIIIADDPERLRPTLRSRFRAIYFSEVSAGEISEWLQGQNISKSKAEQAAKESQGQPGLALRLLTDEDLGEKLRLAREFLKAKGQARLALAKEIASQDDFILDPFLEALLQAAVSAGRKDPRLWHAALELRRQAGYFNLNPRIQLIALAQTF